MNEYMLTIGNKLKIQFQLFKHKWIPFGAHFRKDMFAMIGTHYHNEHVHDLMYAEKVINNIGFTDVWYRNGYLYIESTNPSLIIGHKGSDFNKLEKYIKSRWKMGFEFKGIRLKEWRKYSELRYLFNWQYRYSNWDG